MKYETYEAVTFAMISLLSENQQSCEEIHEMLNKNKAF